MALRGLATSAAYDLRKDTSGGAPELPMLWHYQVVAVHELPRLRSHWPDGTEGHQYTPIVLEVANERLGRAYSDEAEFTAPLPPHTRTALGEGVPLLVRLQYMNECHALNGAAALALVRFAQRFGITWTINDVPVVEIGWRWGSCADGPSISISNIDPATGAQRTKQQAHAHQVCTFMTADGVEYILDLSAAQFGISSANLPCVPALIEAAAGCDQSPTLARRAAEGLAPALFAPLDSLEGSAVLSATRLQRGQQAIEEALNLIDAQGYAVRAHYLLCGHVMPSPWFGRRDPTEPKPDDDLVEGGVLNAFRKFERALHSMREWNLLRSYISGGAQNDAC